MKVPGIEAMTDLRELEKRLEALEDCSEQIDAKTAEAIDRAFPFETEPDARYELISAVRGSLDAAVALVERVLPGWGYFIRKDEEGINASLLYPNALRVSPGCGQHKSSPALALCLALIRALIAKGDRHD